MHSVQCVCAIFAHSIHNERFAGIFMSKYLFNFIIILIVSFSVCVRGWLQEMLFPKYLNTLLDIAKLEI